MKAIVKTGKFKGQYVDVLQWCNDWFSCEQGIFTPRQLLFTQDGMLQILLSENKGLMPLWFEPTLTKGKGEYEWTFKRNIKRPVSSMDRTADF